MKHAKHAIFWSSPSTHFYEVRKHVFLWSMPNMLFYEPRQAHPFMKHTKLPRARKHAKHACMQSAPNMRARKAREARTACKAASTLFSRANKSNYILSKNRPFYWMRILILYDLSFFSLEEWVSFFRGTYQISLAITVFTGFK